MQPSRAAIFAAFSVVAGLACSEGAMGGGACTAMFASIPVSVIDGAGLPVEGATVTAVLVRTGQTLVPTSLMLTVPGTYPLVDDGSVGVLRQSGDPVQAHISRGGQSLSVDYVFAVPDGCHVSKLSGPDTVTLQ
jgi:hypothetical protein